MKRFLVTAVCWVILYPWLFNPLALPAENQETKSGGMASEPTKGGLQSVLTITPREINLGTIGPGEEAKGIFYLKNVGSGQLSWSTPGPEGWTRVENQRLFGMVGDNPEPIKISITFQSERNAGGIMGSSLLLRLEGGGQSALFRREPSENTLRESIRFNYAGGTRTAFFQIHLSELASMAMLEVEPLRMDLGVVRSGEEISRRIHVKNRGRDILKWRAGLAGMKGMPATASLPLGRYISFWNEATVGTGNYTVAGRHGEGLELFGKWAEENGYPAGLNEQSSLHCRFTGTGINLFIWKTPEGGPLNVFVDEQLINVIDGFADFREKMEIDIAADLADTPHVLTIVNGGGRVVLEGIRIFGKPVLKGPHGWITIFPDSGMTTRETDYVNISLNTRQMMPGIYGEQVFFTATGGAANVEVFVEVAAETQSRFLDVHRYLAGSDYLYTTNPQGEAFRLQAKGYSDLGIVFQIFSAGTTGTTAFFRWFNPTKGDHFYSSDPAGGGKSLQGYLFEGSIGNIATFRLSGTKELYRWYNPSTGRHFYTTNQSGEGLGKKGYRFDGIAGFVR